LRRFEKRRRGGRGGEEEKGESYLIPRVDLVLVLVLGGG